MSPLEQRVREAVEKAWREDPSVGGAFVAFLRVIEDSFDLPTPDPTDEVPPVREPRPDVGRLRVVRRLRPRLLAREALGRRHHAGAGGDEVSPIADRPAVALQATIDGGDPVSVSGVTIESEQIDITTEFEPDPKWQYVDPAGHYHARSSEEPELPTLRSIQVTRECDGACGGTCGGEGYTETVWHCLLCDAVVKPGTRLTSGRRYVPGLRSWRAEVEQDIPAGERVSVVIDAGRVRQFGFAVASGFRAEGGPGGVRVWTEVTGTSPLGVRA